MAGGVQINNPDDVKTPTAHLLLIKIFLNSVISIPGAQFTNVDISNFHLMALFKWSEFTKVNITYILKEIIQK